MAEYDYQPTSYDAGRFDHDRLIAGDAAAVIPVSVVCGGSNLARGTVMGRITATSVWVQCLAGASDGSQIPAGILAEDVSAANSRTVVYIAGEFNALALTIGTGHTVESVAEALRDIGVFIKSNVPDPGRPAVVPPGPVYAALSMPAIFSWFTYALYADNTTDYHPDLVRPVGKIYYVKPASQGGNDAADGLTWATALATPITAARKSDCVMVQLAAGRYPNAFWGDTPSFGAAFRGMACDDGVAEFLASGLDDSASFAADGANPGAHKWTGAGTVYGVWDEATPNGFGGWGWLTRRTTAADVASLGGWYSNGTDLWVRLAGGRTPDASVRVNRIRRCNNGRSGLSLWFKGINFFGGSMVVNAAGTAMTIHYYKCRFGYAGTSDDASTLNVGSTTSYTYYYSCKAHHSEKDLFSVQGGNRSFEYDCEAYDTPLAGPNNASTSHGTGNVISVDSYYHDTAGRVIADVSTGGNSGRLMLGCIARNSPGVGSADVSSTGSPLYLINFRNYGSITEVGMDGNGPKYWQNAELVNGFINAAPTAVELYTGPGVTPTLARWGAV